MKLKFKDFKGNDYFISADEVSHIDPEDFTCTYIFLINGTCIETFGSIKFIEEEYHKKE